MEQNVFSVEDYYREETTLESGEPLYFYIKKFFFLSYKNIYVLVHLTNFDTMKGKEICKKVESKLKEEYEYDLRTAVFIMQCIDDFSDEYYKFYEEEIVVPASFIYSFLPAPL